MKVVEIFQSIDGEGITAGYPAVFVRLSGCNLRCGYCDTAYAYEGGKEMTCQEIVEDVKSYGISRVTVTGGEPLIHRGISNLLGRLCEEGLHVNVETNGSVNVHNIRDAVYQSFGGRSARNLFFTIDYKCNSSGENSKMCLENFSSTCPRDVIKFVVGNEEDLNQMKTICSSYHLNTSVFVSPVFGQIDPEEIVQYLLNNRLNQVRLQLQIHKIIWPADMRGV